MKTTGILTTLAAAAITLTGLTAAVPAQADVTVEHLPANVRLAEDNIHCLDFDPALFGHNAQLGRVTVTARNGISYSRFYCPGGNTARLMRMSAGVTFTVKYAYTRGISGTGKKRGWTAWWLYDGKKYYAESGTQFRDAAGRNTDRDGRTTNYDPAAEYAADADYEVKFNPWFPFLYTFTGRVTGQYTTNVRIVP